MKILFIDESGDHNLEKIDSQYPVFVLAGVIFDKDYYDKTAKERIKKFKMKIFGTEKIILHTADICRNRNGFESLADKKFRDNFFEKFYKLIESLHFEIVATGIQKKKHLLRYGIAAIDPYLLSLEFVVERFIFSLDDCKGKGMIVAESRGNQLDNQLELAWLNLKIKGTRFISPTRISEKITDFKILKKSRAVGGLEIADFVVSPIGRKIMGKPIKDDFRIINKKFRRNGSNKIMGHGLIVFPK
ncbi:MAG: hypothetical protein ACD_7C00184G0007 [uncultured bacterium]|nr:MAG: hypothetical protein ACD_7C00184G0007 [uncultured bacterium]HBR78798.1 DUF3800 domain-containing protein [Candidatus Moranbacteria bacterium]